LKKGLVERLSRFQAEPESAKQFLAMGTYKPDASIPPAELAAHGVTASVILNLSEVVTRP
ncbi:MAG: hypothetical protein ACK5TH_11725, partial [Prosthecobacter sp.]